MEVEEEEQRVVGALGVLAKVTNVRLVQNMLKAVSLTDHDETTFMFKDAGLKVTTEDAKSFQANAYFQRCHFHEFKLADDKLEYNFKISMPTVLECLHLFGSSSGLLRSTSTSSHSTLFGGGSALTTLIIHYEKYGEPLKMFMEEDGVVSKAEIPTQDYDEPLQFDFCPPNVIAKVVLVSEYTKDVFSDLDFSSEFLEMTFNKNEKIYGLTTNGLTGEIIISIPDYSETIQIFETEKNFKAKYRMSYLKNALKAMPLSEKLSIRIDKRYFICLQVRSMPYNIAIV